MGRWGEAGVGGGVSARCQSFKPDAAAVSADDASAMSAATQLHHLVVQCWRLVSVSRTLFEGLCLGLGLGLDALGISKDQSRLSQQCGDMMIT